MGFYTVYRFLLQNEKMHLFNRFFLLFALVFGLSAPLISIEIQPEKTIAGINVQQIERAVTMPVESVSNSIGTVITPEPESPVIAETAPVSPVKQKITVSTWNIVMAIYGLVTLFFLIRFISGLLEIRRKINSGSHKKTEESIFVLLDEPITPQSFFWFVFLEKRRFESGEIEPEIFNHELTHVRQLHSFDVMLVEILKIFFWFNPFIYLCKRAIQLNHEFLADESVLVKSSSVSEYQNMLIRNCTGNGNLSVTSSINYSLTKKRLLMMMKPYSLTRTGSKKLVLIPLIAALTLTFCTKEKEPTVVNLSDIIQPTVYYDIELYSDADRSEKLGLPFFAKYTSSGELFTGTKRVYHAETDSLHMKLFYEDGLNTGALMTMNGNIHRNKNRIYLGKPHIEEMYVNEVLVYQDIPPSDNEDGLGRIRTWHRNGKLSVELFYTGYTGNKLYQGLMTTYDEEGNITEQKRYEEGVLVEQVY